MKRISVHDLYDGEYHLSAINALKQQWENADGFSCIGKPKTKNMLLLLNGCRAEYTLKTGEKITAPDGAVVYTPLGSEYRVGFCGFKGENSHTVGVNFLLTDPSGESLVFGETVTVFQPGNADYGQRFAELAKYSGSNVICKGKLKSVLFDVLFRIGEYDRNRHTNTYRVIEKGIRYLEQDEEQSLSIGEIARMCYVSETYFRKKFEEYAGITPTAYRLNAKMNKARFLLKEQELTVTEIAARLGFNDSSYFIRQFRKCTGMTPKKYQMREKHNI